MRSLKLSKPIIRMPGKLLLIILGLLILIGTYKLRQPSPSVSKEIERTPQELMSVLANKLSEKQFLRVELYYYDWGADVCSGLTQDGLLRQYQYKVAIANPLRNTDELQYALSQFKFQEVEEAAFTFRLACIFDMGTDGTLSIFFAGNAPVVSIGQYFFWAEPALLNSVAAFVPHQEYEKMYRSILSQWANSLSLPERPTAAEQEGTKNLKVKMDAGSENQEEPRIAVR